MKNITTYVDPPSLLIDDEIDPTAAESQPGGSVRGLRLTDRARQPILVRRQHVLGTGSPK